MVENILGRNGLSVLIREHLVPLVVLQQYGLTVHVQSVVRIEILDMDEK